MKAYLSASRGPCQPPSTGDEVFYSLVPHIWVSYFFSALALIASIDFLIVSLIWAGWAGASERAFSDAFKASP